MKTIPTPAFESPEPVYPVIRIDSKGRILFANRASFPILREWNCLANDYIPADLVTLNPALLDLDADFDVTLDTRQSSYTLDVIGFKESGYIGLYGFRSEIKAMTSAKSQLAAQF